MKRYYKLLTLIAIFFLASFTFDHAFAATSKLIDPQNILSEVDYNVVEKKLNELSQKNKIEILAVIVGDLEDNDVMATANNHLDTYLKETNKSKATLLLIAVNEHRWALTSSEKITQKTMKALEANISNHIIEALSIEDFRTAFLNYAALVDETIAENKPAKELFSVTRLLISLGLGGLIGLIMASSAKSQLKTIRKQREAKSYLVKSQISQANHNDLYLYEKVTKTPQKKKTSASSEGKF